MDEGIYFLSDFIKISKKLKSVKLVRNKLTDDGACYLLDAVC
jgi:hypothetical protein